MTKKETRSSSGQTRTTDKKRLKKVLNKKDSLFLVKIMTRLKSEGSLKLSLTR